MDTWAASLVTVNHAAVNIQVQVFVGHEPSFLWVASWSGIAGADGKAVSPFEELSVFRGTILPCHQQCTGFQFLHIPSTQHHLGEELVLEPLPN